MFRQHVSITSWLWPLEITTGDHTVGGDHAVGGNHAVGDDEDEQEDRQAELEEWLDSVLDDWALPLWCSATRWLGCRADVVQHYQSALAVRSVLLVVVRWVG